MVSILIDENYSNSLWCKKILGGLTKELRKKRIPFSEFFDYEVNLNNEVFVIAADYYWSLSTIKQLNLYGIKPILICNQLLPLPECSYSCVCSDINTSMHYLINDVESKGCKNIALYGINTNSISDISRVDGIFLWKHDKDTKIRVFTNEGSLEKCYSSFKSVCKDFDCVICSNDFAAISLTENIKKDFPDYLKSIKIISCSETSLGKYYQDDFTSLKLNFEEFGAVAVSILEYITKNPYISTVTVSVNWSFDRPTKPNCEEQIKTIPKKSTDLFYNDSILNEMLVLERFLAGSDEIDRQIINSLLHNKTHEEICNLTYLTESGLKYRIKKILGYSGAKKQDELLSLVKKYLK